MKGKRKCDCLRLIREEMAEKNGIPYESRECDYKGDCSGTCPLCEQEAAELLDALKEKEAHGEEIKTVDEQTVNLALALSRVEDSQNNENYGEAEMVEMGEIADDEEEEMKKREIIEFMKQSQGETLMGHVRGDYHDPQNDEKIKEAYNLLKEAMKEQGTFN